MHLFTRLRTKCALLFSGALLWCGTAFAATEVLASYDFQSLAKEKKANTVLTQGDAYIPVNGTATSNGQYVLGVKVGTTDWKWSSYYLKDFGTDFAVSRIYDTSRTKGFWLVYSSTSDADCGLQSNGEGHTLTVPNLTVGSVVTVTGKTGFLIAANKYTYGGVWSEDKSSDSDTQTDTYVYTITTAGDLNLTCNAGVSIYTLKIEAPVPDVYAPTISVVEGADNTSKKIQVDCKTSNVTINCTINYTDNTNETKTLSSGDTFRIYKSATSITAQAIVGSGDDEKTSDITTASAIKAGEIATPTVTVTKVDGTKRIVKIASTDATASLSYNTDGSDSYTDYESEITISETTTFYVRSQVVDTYDNSYTHTKKTSVEIAADVTVALNSVTFDAEGDVITLTADQSSVLAKPTATITYSYIPVDVITGKQGEAKIGTVASGKSVTLGYGIITATASATGYDDSESTSTEYLPLDVKEIRSWNLSQYNGKAVTAGTALTISGTSCNQVIIDGTVIEDIYTQEAWATKADGLYNGKGGNRLIGIANVKAGQIVTITCVKGTEPLDYNKIVNGEKDLNSTATTFIFRVAADGTFAISLHRYNYVKSIVVSEDLSVSRTITYDALTGYTTFYWNKTIAIPDGVTAYTGKLNEAKDALTLSKIEGDYIPALTPAILVTDEKKGQSETVTEAADAEVEAIDSDLKGILIAQTASDYVDGQAYILSRKEEASSIGFYKFSGETLAANKAYLVLSEASEAPMVRILFNDEVGNVSGIETIETKSAAPARFFDLQGRSLRQAPLKGIYIQDGHKVIR